MGRPRSGEGQQPASRGGPLAGVLLAAAALVLALGAGATPAGASSTASSAQRVHRACGLPPAGAAACTAVRLVSAPITAAQVQAAAGTRGVGVAAKGSPYLTPQSLHAAYALPSETQFSSTQTIAVIDAFDDPTAEADLGVYDETFGLPACTSANGCFRKLNEQGQASPLPAENGEWASEVSIDVQMAHAICQNCHVLLVEASSEEFSDLGAAVNTAVKAGATEISNSYAGPEEPALASIFSELNTSFYDHPGVVITASSGDCGYLDEACDGHPATADFPASSPDVVAVGGTTLTDRKETWNSTVWEEGGSGCSQIFAAPPWQSAVADFSATGCGAERSVADVAAIGNPNTGVEIYDSTPEVEGEPGGWGVWGGTSVASPIIAAEFALAGGSHGVAYPAATLYSHLGDGEDVYDVVSGSNGVCGTSISCQAAVGYDGPTGVGSPIGLGAFSTAGGPVNTSPPTVSGLAEEGQTLTATPGTWTNSPTATSEQWEQCSASGGNCAAIAGATTQKYTLTASDVGSTFRVQEIASNADGVSSPARSAPSAVVSSNVPTLTGFTPSSGITGSTVTIRGTALGGVTGVRFGSLAAHFEVVSATEVEAVVPDGASAGKLSLTTPLGGVQSKSKFTPTLSVKAFSPHSGGPGTRVTIKGVGFSASSTVSFGGVAATVDSASAKKLKVTVPTGALAGAIAVTNVSAPAGTVFSAASFTP
jgi:IPT/TIG domain